MEAIIPTEIGIPTLRTEVPGTANAKAISKDLDMAYKLRATAAIRIASYQQRMANLYNKRIKPRTFRARDLFLRKVFGNTADLEVGKFQPNWKEPYVIKRAGPVGSYALNKLNRVPMPRM